MDTAIDRAAQSERIPDHLIPDRSADNKETLPLEVFYRRTKMLPSVFSSFVRENYVPPFPGIRTSLYPGNTTPASTSKLN